MADIKVSEMTAATTITLADLLMIVQEVSGEDTSMSITLANLANAIVNGIEYTSALDTTSKKIIGAINEVAASSGYIEVTDTLLTGATSITLSDASITSSSFIQVFAGNGNINYTSISATTGSVTIGFLAQASDMTVTVRVS